MPGSKMTPKMLAVIAVVLVCGMMGGRVTGIGPLELDLDCEFPDRCDARDFRRYCLETGDYVRGHCAAKRAWCRAGVSLDLLGRCSCRYNPHGVFCNLEGTRNPFNPDPSGPRGPWRK